MSAEQKRNPILRTVLYIALILAAVLIYAYGWRATDINLEVPQEQQRQQQVVRALRGLLSPEVFDRDTESQIAYAYFQIPCSDEPVEQPDVSKEEPYITIRPTCGQPREDVTIEGFNFRPYSDGLVRWTSPGGLTRPLGTIHMDGQGHFIVQFSVPSASEMEEPYTVEAEISWPVGWPRASEALKVTLERMIETIFLALMATTFAIVVAIPLSFIAAYNLMRQIRMPLGGFLATLLPLPLGWVLGRQFFQPVNQLALTAGSTGWLGVPILLLILAGVYFTTTKYMPRPGPIANPWLAGLVRYARMLVMVVVLLFVAGLLSGIGIQISNALSGFLDGLLSNIITSLANLLRLLLPAFAGVAGALILGSLVDTLLEPLLDRVNNPFIQRALGFILGAMAGALMFYLVYLGVYTFYNPGEPIPYLLYVTLAGGILGGGLGLALRADYSFAVGLLIYYVTRTVLNALRSIEPLIMAIVFAIWVSIGPFAGVLALTLHSIAALGKLYSEQVESIDAGPIEAITSTGATRLQTILYGVVPQIVPPYIAFTLYRWDINVRMSTIIGFVGGGGIGFVLQQWINLLQYRKAGVAVLAIAIVVAALDYVSAQARERIT